MLGHFQLVLDAKHFLTWDKHMKVWWWSYWYPIRVTFTPDKRRLFYKYQRSDIDVYWFQVNIHIRGDWKNTLDYTNKQTHLEQCLVLWIAESRTLLLKIIKSLRSWQLCGSTKLSLLTTFKCGFHNFVKICMHPDQLLWGS